jgi:hypothetical protein
LTPPRTEDRMPSREPAEQQADEPRWFSKRLLVQLASRIISWSQRRRARRSPGRERLLLVAAILLFAGATLFAYRNLPDTQQPVRWIPLVVVSIITVPGITVLNALEYRVAGRIIGHRIRMLPALRVSVIASAANQLPIPGAALVRIRALRQLGSTYGKGTVSTGTAALAWIGTTGAIAGVFQFPSGRWEFGTVLLGVGLAILTLSFGVLRWQDQSGSPVRLMAQLILIETGATGLSAIKTYIALEAIGFRVTPAQAMALVVSIVIAAATGFFPGGLGIRELIAAGLSPLVGLPVTVGLVATAVSRVAGTAVFLVLTGAFLMIVRRRAGDEASEPSGAALISHE